MQELGNLLRQLRDQESLRDVSSRSGISHTYLGIIEKGIDQRSGNPVKPTPDTLKTLAKAYNYSYEELMRKAGYLQESSEPYLTEYNLSPKSIELVDFIKSQQITYRGKELTEAERKKILDMLKLLFQE
ncbi:XRE family transcriptional regulator [Paenibacillus psychroresistens]|uniref:XRE family transcriptional regulator n=1 Tax=Paenibacillus psychroresistens TaxID=1778678 RepID=A0A6B8RQ83_9BACL|nr:helix-turn-helix domain-containing protein [Paenibacillus psychroresistens]QGQ97997.1 XRE family transcriptional regulator [Paenibacillus psychroresistens]